MRSYLCILFFMLFTVAGFAQDTVMETFKVAIQLNKEQDFETSNILCSKVIASSPELAGAYFLRAYNNFMLKNYNESIPDFTAALSKDPNYFEALYYRAKARQAKGDYIGAISDFNAARELSPSQTTFFVIKGLFSSIFGGDSKK